MPKNSETLHVRCPVELLEVLRRLAEADRRTEADYVRLLIYRDAEKKGVIKKDG